MTDVFLFGMPTLVLVGWFACQRDDGLRVAFSALAILYGGSIVLGTALAVLYQENLNLPFWCPLGTLGCTLVVCAVSGMRLPADSAPGTTGEPKGER